MSGPRAELLGGLESWVEEERGIPGVPFQSVAQPRRYTLRERKEAPEPASRLKVRGGRAGVWWGWVGAPSQCVS